MKTLVTVCMALFRQTTSDRTGVVRSLLADKSVLTDDECIACNAEEEDEHVQRDDRGHDDGPVLERHELLADERRRGERVKAGGGEIRFDGIESGVERHRRRRREQSANTHKTKVVKVDADEFLHRFLNNRVVSVAFPLF